MREVLAHRRQFGIFILGGFLCAAIDIGVMQLLLAGGSHVAMATSAGFGVGLVVNYLFHARVTFDSPTSGASLLRFACLVGINYLLTLACVGLAVHWQFAPLVGKLVSLPLVAINGFILGKFWIFK